MDDLYTIIYINVQGTRLWSLTIVHFDCPKVKVLWSGHFLLVGKGRMGVGEDKQHVRRGAWEYYLSERQDSGQI